MSRPRSSCAAAPVSLRLDVRPLAVTAALALVAAATLVLSVAVGEFPVPPLDVLASLAGAGDTATDFIVVDLRLPRALTALLAGAALGVAGAIFQEVTRNPLVSPDIVGVSGGASLAAVAVIVFGSPTALRRPARRARRRAPSRRGAVRARVARRRARLPARARRHRRRRAHPGRASRYVLTEGRIFEVAGRTCGSSAR